MALEEARNEAERMKHDKSNLQSSLNALQRKWIPGIGAFKQWVHDGLVPRDILLLHDGSPASSNENVLAHNALVHVRSKNWGSAYQDAKKSIDIRPSAVGYIAKALAQIGNGDPEKAIQTFDLAFLNCNPNEINLLLLIRTIVFFVAGKHDEAISRAHDLITVPSDDETMYCCNQVLAKMYLLRDDFKHAVHSLERAQAFTSSRNGRHLQSISLIFGWNFDGIDITALRYQCEALHSAGRAEDFAEALRKILESFSEEIRASEETKKWVTELKKKCVHMLEGLGDTALSSGEHAEAISRYSSALSLKPSNPIDILLKRSQVRALKGLWKDALADANEVIRLDPSSHRGYERKHAALHGAEDYGEANNAIMRMLSIIENSLDEEVRRLRENYTTPREIITAIDTATREIFNLCPLVLIDITTGRLCDAQERVRMFRSETPFKKLISETAIMKMDHAHIYQSVARYFKWVMFSHTWEGKEPTLKDVNLVDSVWKLDGSPLNEKLRQFCATAREDGYRWAWSDTCCIDKDTSAVLSQSLTSMYTWYERAAATLVYLADVLSSAELGDLTNSRWMTRAWTLQELLASGVIRFYNSEWKLYLNDTHANHKESPAIKQELARAMGVTPETITSFRPEELGVREKLRLASKRHATIEEDIAYSLIGIFSSDIVPRYGLGKTALGHLLENIVARSGDITVIAWTGKSLPYNSALPASLEVYSQKPYTPPPMAVGELDARVEQLRARLSPQLATESYNQVRRLPRATFLNRCLHLPCILFSVKKIVQGPRNSQEFSYHATVSFLGKVEFTTADVMPLAKPRKLFFIHPWIHDLIGPHDEFVSDDESDESEAASDANSDNIAVIPSLRPGVAARVDCYTQGLQLIARLEQPFKALLLEQQLNGQYKRIAAEHEIRVPGIPHETSFRKGIRAKVLEIA